VIKANFGCGDNILEGWNNHDIRLDGLDCAERLPYDCDTVNFILAEHLIEHMQPHEALFFLDECYRVLKPGGVARIGIPDLDNIKNLDGSYEVFLNIEIASEKRVVRSRRDSMRTVMTHWGHKSFWTGPLLEHVLWTVGFENVIRQEYGKSEHIELSEIDGHYKKHRLEELYPGVSAICRKEVTTLEATKGD